MAESTVALPGLSRLAVPAPVRKGLERFCSELVGLYGADLLSITAFGSAAGGDFLESSSDVNLLVICRDLDIADLRDAARLARRWRKARRITPRFLSWRNLVNGARYFQVDLLGMRAAHVVLFGNDLLDDLPVSRADLHWQVAHEIKRMRMRVKQQYWMASGDPAALARVLRQRFASLVHLLRALLWLRSGRVVVTRGEVLADAVRELGVDAAFVERMAARRGGGRGLRGEEAAAAFEDLMRVIRLVDELVDAERA